MYFTNADVRFQLNCSLKKDILIYWSFRYGSSYQDLERVNIILQTGNWFK